MIGWPDVESSRQTVKVSVDACTVPDPVSVRPASLEDVDGLGIDDRVAAGLSGNDEGVIAGAAEEGVVAGAAVEGVVIPALPSR